MRQNRLGNLQCAAPFFSSAIPSCPAARGSNDGGQSTGSSSIAQPLKDRRLVIFLICAVLFHFANAAGTGRFNLTLGAVTTAVGIGAALSQSIAGGIVHHFGYHAGFLFLAAVAAGGVHPVVDIHAGNS
jgi:hypothetical protein